MKIHNAVVCDQVRTEDSGKHIIIGTYHNDILFDHFPAQTTLVTWLQFMVEESGEHEIEYRVTKDRKTISHARGKMAVLSSDKMQTLILPPMALQIDGEGNLVFQIREKKMRWKTLVELLVRKKPR